MSELLRYPIFFGRFNNLSLRWISEILVVIGQIHAPYWPHIVNGTLFPALEFQKHPAFHQRARDTLWSSCWRCTLHSGIQLLPEATGYTLALWPEVLDKYNSDLSSEGISDIFLSLRQRSLDTRTSSCHHPLRTSLLAIFLKNVKNKYIYFQNTTAVTVSW